MTELFNTDSLSAPHNLPFRLVINAPVNTLFFRNADCQSLFHSQNLCLIKHYYIFECAHLLDSADCRY